MSKDDNAEQSIDLVELRKFPAWSEAYKAADYIESQARRIAELELIIKGKTFVTGRDVPPSAPLLTNNEIVAICKRFIVEGYHGDYLEDNGYHLAQEIERIVLERVATPTSRAPWCESCQGEHAPNDPVYHRQPIETGGTSS